MVRILALMVVGAATLAAVALAAPACRRVVEPPAGAATEPLVMEPRSASGEVGATVAYTLSAEATLEVSDTSIAVVEDREVRCLTAGRVWVRTLSRPRVITGVLDCTPRGVAMKTRATCPQGPCPLENGECITICENVCSDGYTHMGGGTCVLLDTEPGGTPWPPPYPGEPGGLPPGGGGGGHDPPDPRGDGGITLPIDAREIDADVMPPDSTCDPTTACSRKYERFAICARRRYKEECSDCLVNLLHECQQCESDYCKDSGPMIHSKCEPSADIVYKHGCERLRNRPLDPDDDDEVPVCTRNPRLPGCRRQDP